jgi:predicted AlkP superfamily phosphohydrolase/phosphomutase
MRCKNRARREFIFNSLATCAAFSLPTTAFPAILTSSHLEKTIVLGIDGMDYDLTTKMLQNGELPNLQKLAANGHFGRLETTMPPQSPVAWSSFITGTNPGGHGIYDFIHRDAKTFIPYLSTSRSYPGENSLSFSDFVLPLDSGRIELKRKGRAIWDCLADASIPTTVFALPANFPVEERSKYVRGISGMGTPDLLGSYGRYTLLSDNRQVYRGRYGIGQVSEVTFNDNHAQAKIVGPSSPYSKKGTPSFAEINLWRDRDNNVAMIKVADESLILMPGEWSEWVALEFEFLPLISKAKGAVRFYLKSIAPYFELYISPVQIDPFQPAMPICTPADYSAEIASKIGRFYTQGLPADTKALSEGALTSYEFLQQAKLVLAENLAAFDFEYSRFNVGCLIFYFSSLDQNSHMLMRCMQPEHPLYEANAVAEVKDAIRFYYRAIDQVVGRVVGDLDSKTALYILSDHGFAPFTREFHLSSWLFEKGFTALKNPAKKNEIDFYQGVDWERSQAYALGINGIYINLKGRERFGVVEEAQAEKIKNEIIKELESQVDPRNNSKIVKAVYRSDKIYSGAYLDIAPDLLVGYNSGYRISDQAILGGFPDGIISDRRDPWSSDHCIDPTLVPGVIFSNRKALKNSIGIWDLAPTILNGYNITPPPSMTGKVVF